MSPLRADLIASVGHRPRRHALTPPAATTNPADQHFVGVLMLQMAATWEESVLAYFSCGRNMGMAGKTAPSPA